MGLFFLLKILVARKLTRSTSPAPSNFHAVTNICHVVKYMTHINIWIREVCAGLGEKSVAADISEQSPKSKRQRTNPAVELQNGTSTYHDQVQELFNRANQELATSATNGDLGLATDDGAKARRVLEFAASLGKPPEGRPISVAAERPRVAGKKQSSIHIPDAFSGLILVWSRSCISV